MIYILDADGLKHSLPPSKKVKSWIENLKTLDLLENDEVLNRYFKYNVQNKRCGQKDVCKDRLFSDDKEELFEIPTIKALIAMRDNYIRVCKFSFNISLFCIRSDLKDEDF